MKTEDWTLLVTGMGVLAGLITLSLVLRNEFRERRRLPPVVWGFHRFATAQVDGEQCEAAELVQYGRMPTRMLNYTPVGFDFKLVHEHRVRSYVKAEDTMPLFLTNVDTENAWLLIMHFPRDDRRFLYAECVDLDPTSEGYKENFDAQLERLKAKHSRGRGLIQKWWWRVTRGSIVRPVGPTGYRLARLRVDGRRKSFSQEDMDTILSLATARGASSYRPY